MASWSDLKFASTTSGSNTQATFRRNHSLPLLVCKRLPASFSDHPGGTPAQHVANKEQLLGTLEEKKKSQTAFLDPQDKVYSRETE